MSDAEDRAAPRHLVGVESGRDWTEPMETFAAGCTARLEELEVSGYIFKARSPSCGLKEVPIHTADNVPIGEGSGLFAAVVRARFPDLPVVEESDLADAAACRAFLARVRAYTLTRVSHRDGAPDTPRREGR